MVIDLMVERIWPVARPIILSWTDEASEIFIIDLPLGDLPRILSQLRTELSDPRLLRLDGVNMAHARAFDQALQNRVVATSDRSTVHCLRGDIADQGANSYFYLWTDAIHRSLEVEVVFWNDVCFPPGKPLKRHKAVLGRLLRIAESLRGDNHQSKCILSHEYNAEPHQLLSSAKVAIW